MNNSTPTAQSGPSDRAIAQAFHELHTTDCLHGDALMLYELAVKIESAQPPAGARDAVTDQFVAECGEAYFFVKGMSWDKESMRAAIEFALTGKADGAQPAATGAVEGVWMFKDRAGRWNTFSNDTHRANTIASGDWDVRLFTESQANTAATGMGDAGKSIARLGVDVAAAEALGATGSPASEPERLTFEAWMRGHCWALCATWNGTEYRGDTEQAGHYSPQAATTRMLWAAWRDRAALAAQPAPVVGGDRMAIKMLVAAGFVTEAKANEALQIAHGFTSGELAARPGGEGATPAMRIVIVDRGDGFTAIRHWDNIGELPAGEHFLYTHPAQAGGGRE